MGHRGRTEGTRSVQLRYRSGGYAGDLLFCAAMLVSSLVALGVWWHALQSLPGFVECAAYLLAIWWARFTLEIYFEREAPPQ